MRIDLRSQRSANFGGQVHWKWLLHRWESCGGTETACYCSILKACTCTVNILLNNFKLSITTNLEYLKDNGYEVISTYLKVPNIYRVFYMSGVVK